MAAHQAPVPGILQARIMEWVAISFSSAWKWKVKVKLLSPVQLFATPWTAAYQAPPSMGFPRQEYWSGLPLPSPRVTAKFGLGIQNEAGQRLIEFCQENSLVIANTLFQQHKRRLYTWTSPDGQHWNQIDYILCSQRWRSSIQSTNTRPGSECVSDQNSLLPNSDLNWRN